MQRILLFGATGRTGQLLMHYALEKGYAVTALVRNPEKIKLQSPQLTVIKGLPTNAEDVRKAIADCDIVISTLSALADKDSMSFKKIVPPHTLERSIQNVLAAGKRRIITLSSIGAGNSYHLAPWYMRLFIRISNFKIVFADHNKQESLLMQSGMDWTIARPVALNNEMEVKQLVISYDQRPSPFKMSRRQLAQFMVDCIDDQQMIGKAPILSEA